MINNITKKMQDAEKQLMNKEDYILKKAGFDYIGLRQDGFKYDPELSETDIVKQAEMFCESVITSQY